MTDLDNYRLESIQPGDIFLSLYHGSWVSNMIAGFQGGFAPAHRPWSHCGVVVGPDRTAEATWPKGGFYKLSDKFSEHYTIVVFRLDFLSAREREKFVEAAITLAPRPYDGINIARHLVDNFFERLFWNPVKQRGPRPLSKLFPDCDKDRENVCSELLERALYSAAGMKFQDGKVGQARPMDVWNTAQMWCKTRFARTLIWVERGEDLWF